MTIYYKIAICACLCFFTNIAFAKPLVPIVKIPTAQSWMTQQWTADDTPYQQIQQEIEARLASDAPTNVIFQEYKQKMQPGDIRSLYAMGYAGLVTGLATADTLQEISHNDPQNIYLYTRLHFLLTRTVLANADLRYLQPVGNRLLKRSPQDEMVHKNLVYALSSSKAGVPQALVIAESWVAAQPKSAAAHAVLASVYDTLFSYSRATNQNYCYKAVAEYKKYLQIAPANDHFRRQATFLINLLPQEKPW